MNEFITIGKIVRAAGIKGEIKIYPITDDPARFNKLKIAYVNKKAYRIENCRIGGDFVYLKFAGVDDRNAAESLKDCTVEIDRVNAVPLDEGSYFIAEIVGCKLYLDDGTALGKVTEVNQFGAADVFTATDGKRVVRFPFLKKMIVKVDVENSVIVIKKQVFDEVAIYED